MPDNEKKSTILIVDDIPANIRVLSHALMQDYEIIAAINGEEALQIVAEELPDMILLDIRMPGMNGFTVCERLKANETTCNVPVIFITAENDPEHEVHGLSVGAVDFIVKPINPPVVLSRIRTHMALKEAEMRAIQAADSKSKFLALMSHEIRTPLNGIIGFANLLTRQPLNEQGRQFLDIIRNSGQHLLVVINDILDYSKIESNKIALESIPFNIRKILSGVSDLLALSAHDKGVTFSWRCEEAIPTDLCGDPNRLRQVLLNLGSNAIKFTVKGRVDLEVSLVKQVDEAILLQFLVRDTGIGISADILKTLFKPFTQADVSTTRQFGGTGLGLVICAKLVQLMGGEIQVESEPGKGSCFYFTAYLVIAPQMIEVTNHIADNITLDGCFNNDNRLLVVEDVEVNRLYIKELLSSFGICSVDFACNGQDALEYLQKGTFDLVLMDCQMPVMDGFEATRALRRLEKAGESKFHTPVIALTANVMEEDRLNCFDAGMDGFLTKPLEEKMLVAELRRWLRFVPASHLPQHNSSDPEEKSITTPVSSVPYPDSPLNESLFAEKARKMGKERIGRLIHAFSQDLARNMDELHTAVTTGDAGKISQSAHALKGCCGVVHAVRMAQMCGELESMGRRGEIQESFLMFEKLEMVLMFEKLEIEQALIVKTLEIKSNLYNQMGE
ncbi:MAG: response regulator [Magnetococcales bacterium]|nr:response regulator [Magnetococcales bacterium]